MSRPRNPIPTYRRHKKSGQAIVTLTGPAGVRRDYLLGKYNSRESKAEYTRLIQEWEAAGAKLPPKPGESSKPSDLTVNELLVAYWIWASKRYVKNGEPTSEQDAIRICMRFLRDLYGHTLAREFGPLALKAVRKAMVDHRIVRMVNETDPATGEKRQVEREYAKGLARGNINKLIGRIKSLFKWAASNELVPPSTFQAVSCVAGLRRGEEGTRESKPVRPVSEEVIDATLSHLPPMVADMVRMQRLTGARPGEIVHLRTCDLDTRGPVWEYRPDRHKTEHHDRERIIFLGPKAQAILRGYLTCNLTAPVFSPAASEERRNLQKRAARRTPLTPAAMKRRTQQNPQGRAGAEYGIAAYRRAISRACEKAALPRWTPHQLRHNAATDVRRRFGLEAAQAILGHSEIGVTQIYAEKDMETARRVMAEVG